MSALERKPSIVTNPTLYTTRNCDCFQENLLKGQSALRRYALSLTSDLTEAEDLVQETTLRALKNRRKFVENVNFNGWLTTIMRNIYLNDYERKSRHRELIDRSVDVYNVSMPAEGSYYTPDAAFNLAEIKSEIDKLGDIARIPFKMYLKGYKYAEIAEELDLPVGTIKSRIFFARKELQKNLIDLKY